MTNQQVAWQGKRGHRYAGFGADQQEMDLP